VGNHAEAPPNFDWAVSIWALPTAVAGCAYCDASGNTVEPSAPSQWRQRTVFASRTVVALATGAAVFAGGCGAA
jgi:hypothetical protein